MVFWNPISHAHTLVRFETTVKQIKQAAYQILDTLMQYKVYLDIHRCILDNIIQSNAH